MSAARALIADDEPNLASDLRERLGRTWPQLEILPLAANGLDAMRAASEDAPDIAFLDIRMPGMDGLELARHLTGLEQAPAVVFITAHDKHALEAFELNALDYLLKPVRATRLAAALKKAASAGAPRA